MFLLILFALTSIATTKNSWNSLVKLVTTKLTSSSITLVNSETSSIGLCGSPDIVVFSHSVDAGMQMEMLLLIGIPGNYIVCYTTMESLTGIETGHKGGRSLVNYFFLSAVSKRSRWIAEWEKGAANHPDIRYLGSSTFANALLFMPNVHFSLFLYGSKCTASARVMLTPSPLCGWRLMVWTVIGQRDEVGEWPLWQWHCIISDWGHGLQGERGHPDTKEMLGY